MIRKTLIAAAAALPLALATPASAHGFNWGGFAAGAVVGGIVGSLARPYYYAPYYAPPVYVAPPPYVAPQVYYPSCTPPVHYDQHPPYCAPFGPSGYVIPPPDAMAFWIQASLNALMGARLEVEASTVLPPPTPSRYSRRLIGCGPTASPAAQHSPCCARKSPPHTYRRRRRRWRGKSRRRRPHRCRRGKNHRHPPRR